MFKPIRLLASVLFLISLCPLNAPAQTASVRSRAELNEMQQVLDAWDTAFNKRDQYGLENVLSPQLVDIAATGDVTTRNQDVARLFVKDALPVSLKQTVVDVRTLTPNIKVVNGTYVMHWVAAGTANTMDEKGVFTQVFELVGGRWLCVNSQRTVVAEQGPPAKVKTAATKTKTNAAEPFHIPLIYKGAQSTQPAQTSPPDPPQ
jgi:hypothetical protein